MDLSNIVAANARNIRLQKELTLDAAAALTGVSRSMLAQIEKGEANPTISVLWKIANGYKVSFTSLIEQGETVSVLRREGQAPLLEDEGRYQNWPVFPFDEARPFETYRILVAPGGTLSAQPHLQGTEEYITVFSGQVEITVDGQLFSLNEGDSIRFKANVPHAYRNPGQTQAQLSMLIYYN